MVQNYLPYIYKILYHCRIQTASTQQKHCISRLQCSIYSYAGRFIL